MNEIKYKIRDVVTIYARTHMCMLGNPEKILIFIYSLVKSIFNN